VHPGLAVTVVRPAALVGPDIDTVVTRHFEAPRLLTVKGGSPAWQFCHVDDLATALVATVELDLGPVVTVGSKGWMTQLEVEAVSGMLRVELSESMALGIGQRLHRVGILPFPASDLAFAVYPWDISSATLAEAGWQPAYDNMTCLVTLIDSITGHHAVGARRLDRKDAALGAASAAVALVGTAAIMRRRRRKGAGK
jgi:nucleoside-diphosphate-sugar epimerase